MLLNYTDNGAGEPIVLLHGMAGSMRYWEQFVPLIAKNHRIISIDLIGFGRSPMPNNVTYDYQTHVQAIRQTLDHIGILQPFILVGHSMGALIALRLAALHPNTVKKLILIAMPIYTSPQQAHAAITSSSKLKELAYYGISSKVLCNTWCRYLRPISSRLAPKYLTYLSKAAAADSVLHTWQSYAQSLHFIIEKQDVFSDLPKTLAPITIVYGDTDLPQEFGKLKSNINIKKDCVRLFPGTHQVLNEQKEKIARLVV